MNSLLAAGTGQQSAAGQIPLALSSRFPAVFNALATTPAANAVVQNLPAATPAPDPLRNRMQAVDPALHAAPQATSQITLDGIPTQPIFAQNVSNDQKLQAVTFMLKTVKEAVESSLDDHGTSATAEQRTAIKAILNKASNFGSLVEVLTSPELLNIFRTISKTYGTPLSELASTVSRKAESLITDKDTHATNPFLVDLAFSLLSRMIGSSENAMSKEAATALLRTMRDSEGRYSGASILQDQIRQNVTPVATRLFESLRTGSPATFLRAVLGDSRFGEKDLDPGLKEQTTHMALAHPNPSSRLASFDALNDTALNRDASTVGTAEKMKLIEMLQMLSKVLATMQPTQAIPVGQQVQYEVARAQRIVQQKLAELQSPAAAAGAIAMNPQVAAEINAGTNPLNN